MAFGAEEEQEGQQGPEEEGDPSPRRDNLPAFVSTLNAFKLKDAPNMWRS